MWTYHQLTGLFTDRRVAFQGYAGQPPYVNQPNFQHLKEMGPLPRGTYDILAPVDHALLGPYVLKLMPAATNNMFGREAFYIHGDKKEGPPQKASHGCIILPRLNREAVWLSSCHQVEVINAEG